MCVVFLEIKICFMNCEHRSHDEPFAKIFLFYSFKIKIILFLLLLSENERDDSPKGLFAQTIKKWK